MAISLEIQQASRNWPRLGPTSLRQQWGPLRGSGPVRGRLETRLPSCLQAVGALILRESCWLRSPAPPLLPPPLLPVPPPPPPPPPEDPEMLVGQEGSRSVDGVCVDRVGSSSEWLIRDRHSLRSGFRQIGRSYEHEFEWPTFQFEPTLPSPKKSVPCHAKIPASFPETHFSCGVPNWRLRTAACPL